MFSERTCRRCTGLGNPSRCIQCLGTLKSYREGRTEDTLPTFPGAILLNFETPLTARTHWVCGDCSAYLWCQRTSVTVSDTLLLLANPLQYWLEKSASSGNRDILPRCNPDVVSSWSCAAVESFSAVDEYTASITWQHGSNNSIIQYWIIHTTYTRK